MTPEETKEQLKKEFDDWYFKRYNCYLENDQFDWFYTKFQEKDKEMAELTKHLYECDQELDKMNELQSQLSKERELREAAEKERNADLIGAMRYIDPISRCGGIKEEQDKYYKEVLEQYNNSKEKKQSGNSNN